MCVYLSGFISLILFVFRNTFVVCNEVKITLYLLLGEMGICETNYPSFALISSAIHSDSVDCLKFNCAA